MRLHAKPLRPASVLFAVLLTGSALGGCTTIHEAVATPTITPLVYPSAQSPQRQPMLESRDDSPRPNGSNSLWRNGARSFFHDQRAAKVGDILTVNIAITDSAKVQNETVANRSANSTMGVSNFLGLTTPLKRLLPKGFDPANAVGTNSSLKSDGQGSVNRSEAVTMTVAAIVASVLPNGNLVIQGHQEVRINQELRELTLAGIVRPEDITSANTISHTQIAEARISYGGKGQVSNVQKVPAAQALLSSFSPF